MVQPLAMVSHSPRSILIHLAAAYGPHPEVLALLIVHGVDLTIKNKHDLTPRKEARKQSIDVFKLYESGEYFWTKNP